MSYIHGGTKHPTLEPPDRQGHPCPMPSASVEAEDPFSL
jgi:hypothetical protein